ncbi:DUF2730 family protein [Halocynthiibacter styelae]|uniref:DUF2730 family protein n=1 Tax=Halocynthiibacter styelae TaxID=2761955 RepID=A0A8J7IFW9_9RHOB|nr:DUF2730 family protein [Paenihalocynthiibacter styelae]MBI1495387.1 DUF2730 family protein [Paenihalocynthiibacter styelae]
MDNQFLQLMNSGPVGALVVGVVLLIGFLLRHTRWFSGGSSGSGVAASEFSALSSQVREMDQRLGVVEQDLRHLPTREELHEVEVNIARLMERMSGLEQITTSTNRAVGRIEDFMIDASQKQKGQ